MRTPRFGRGQIITLSRLLNMLYRPSEIAAEIDVSVETVYRSYLPAGAPYEKDGMGNIWINGRAFRGWAEGVIGTRKANKPPMGEGLAWCLKCNQAVEIVNPRRRGVKRNLAMLQGACPICGTRVFRTVSARAENDGEGK